MSLVGVRSARDLLRALQPLIRTREGDKVPFGDQREFLVASTVRRLAESDDRSLLVIDDFAGLDADEEVYRLVTRLVSVTNTANGNFKLVLACAASALAGFVGCAVVRLSTVGVGLEFTREVLMKHAGVVEDAARPLSEEDEQFVDVLRERCAGLPLALSIAGRAVRAIRERGSGTEGAWEEYARVLDNLAERGDSLGECGVVEGVDGVFMAGLVCLQMSWPEELPMNSKQALLSLCALRKGDRVCVQAFAQTWGMEVDKAQEVVERLERGGFLVRIHEWENECDKYKMHECVRDFGAALTARTGCGMVPWHRKVVDAFGESLPIVEGDTNGDDLHHSWSGQKAGEHYLSENIIRHLLLAEKLDLALKLLIDYRWIQHQNAQKEQDPFQAVLSDVALLQDLLEDEINLEMSSDRISTLTAILADLDFLSEAMKQAMPACIKNRHECSFQLHGRLCGLQGETNIMEWCVRSIEKFSLCPWARPEEGILEQPVLKLKRSFPQERSLDYIALYPRVSVNGLLVARKNGTIDILCGKKGVVRNTLRRSQSPEQGGIRHIWVGSNRTSEDVYSLSQSTEGIVLRVWKGNGSPQEFRPFLADQEITCATLMQSGVLACGTRQGTIYIVDCCTGTSLRELPADLELLSLTATPDAQTLVSLSSTHSTLRVWDMAQETRQRSFKCASGSNCVAISGSGQFLACGRLDGMIQIFSTTTGTELKLLTRHTESVSCVSFSPDDKYVYSGSLDHTIVVWDLSTGGMRRRSGQHEEAITSMALGKGGNELYYASENSISVLAARPALSENEDYAMNSALRNVVQAYCVSTNSNTLVTVETDRICFRDGRGPNTVYEALHHKPTDNHSIYSEIRIAAQGSSHSADCIAISPKEDLVAYSFRIMDIGTIQVYIINRETGSTVLLDDIGISFDSDGFLGCETEKLSFVFGEVYLNGVVRFDFTEILSPNRMYHSRFEVMWNVNGALVYAEEVPFIQDNPQVMSSTTSAAQEECACLYMVDRYQILLDRPEVTLLATLPKGIRPIMSTVGTTELPALNAVNFVKSTGRLWFLNEDYLLQYVDLKDSSSEKDDTPPPLPIPRIAHIDRTAVHNRESLNYY